MLTIWLNYMVNIESATIQATEEKILSAATLIFRARGKEGARMQDIADEAGINKALLHYYFHSKDLLFEKVFKENSNLFFSKLNQIIQSDTALFDKIDNLCDAYISMSLENPFIPILIIDESNKNPSEFIQKLFSGSNKKPNFNTFKEQIRLEVKAGKIKPTNPEHLIMNILGLCIFPVISRPMMKFTMGLSDREFTLAMEERKKIVPAFIIESIRKK